MILTERRKIYVVWRDHYSSGGWHDCESIQESDRGKVVESLGFLVFEDKHCLRIARSICAENDTCADPVVILKETVVKRRFL